MIEVDLSVAPHGLHGTGAFEATGAQPWRDYANALVAAKDLADRQAMSYTQWPVVVVCCAKSRAGQSLLKRVDLGGPDLTALPDWPKLLLALREDRKHGVAGRVGACERLFTSMGWTAVLVREAGGGAEDAALIIRPPRPLFGNNPHVSEPASSSLIDGLAPRLQRGDVIVGLDGVAITWGSSQIAALIDVADAPCEHVFVVRREGAPHDATAISRLDSLVRQDDYPSHRDRRSRDALVASAEAPNDKPGRSCDEQCAVQ